MEIVKLENGNFKVSGEGLGYNLLDDLVNSHELDFTIAGDEGCASNYDMYYPLYNHYTGLLYLILGSELTAYEQGEWVLVEGRELDDNDREELEREGVI